MWYHERVEYGSGVPFRWFSHNSPLGPLHWHVQFEVLLVARGPVVLQYADREFLLETGDTIPINCNQIHSVTACNPQEQIAIRGIQVDPAFCAGSFPDLEHTLFDLEAYRAPEQRACRDQVKACILQMEKEIHGQKAGTSLLLSSLLYRIMYLLVSSIPYRTEPESSPLPQRDMARLKRVIRYVEQNYSQKITMREVAEREHLNPYYFSHFFKEKTWTSFQDFVLSVRLEKASQKLVATEDRVMDILLACGFSDSKQFYRRFKQRYGVTPNEYRKQHKLLDYNRMESLKQEFVANEL